VKHAVIPLQGGADSAGFGGGGRDNDRRGGALSALAMMILAPLAAMLIQLAISRSREYEANATGARITAKAAQIMKREGKRLALATQCIGGGQGIATVLEAV